MNVVRRATAADVSAMASLLAQLSYPTSADDLPQRLSAIEAAGGIAFVALDDAGQIVGLASGARLATLHAGRQVAYITALVTAAEARGRGVGRSLVDAIVRWAQENECTRLSVTSAEHRADAHAFYPRCGLSYSGRRFTRIIEQAVARDAGE